MKFAPDIASCNGSIMPLSDLKIAVTHPVFMSSYGVYESIQVDQGRPFHLTDHLRRLEQSAALLNMPWPFSIDTLSEWALALVNALPSVTFSLQILAFGPEIKDQPPSIIFLAKPLATYPDHFYREGAGAITFEGERYLPRCKSMNTLVNHLARTEAQQAGALEALLVGQGQLLEGARSNLFAVIDNKQLVTAPSDKVLSGVTRDLVIKLMRDTAHPVIECEISLSAPLTELFITSTSMHVMPLTRLNEQPVGDGQVGPITKLAVAKFEHYYGQMLSEMV